MSGDSSDHLSSNGQESLSISSADLRRRLKRLGLTTGRNLKPADKKQDQDIHNLVDGQIHQSEQGTYFKLVHMYSADKHHGQWLLTEWLKLKPKTLAGLGADEELALVQPEKLVFLDTETTGLGGIGTLAFEVGVGFFNEAGQFEIHQFFLRDPAEENAMLHALQALLPDDCGLVTFNGRTFDVPLLAGRFILNRLPAMISELPNLDLLSPARRLWKRRLPSCSLSSLERHILQVRRTGEDVPGHLIPALYNQYLRTKNAVDMLRVLYHNEIDLISMISLGLTLAQVFEAPEAPDLHIDDRLSLARWYTNHKRNEQGEIAYRAAVDNAPDAITRHEALIGLAMMLKRADRRKEAVSLWEDVADLKFDVQGHEELAKYYEWHAPDLNHALNWTEQGIQLAETWYPGLRRTEALGNLNHRRARLIRKISNAPQEDDLAPEE